LIYQIEKLSLIKNLNPNLSESTDIKPEIFKKQWKHDDIIELSPNQLRLYKKRSSIISGMVKIPIFERNSFEIKFKQFLSIFPCLRLNFEQFDNKIYQRFIPVNEVKFNLKEENYSNYEYEEIEKLAEDYLFSPFKISNGNQIRLLVIKEGHSNKNVRLFISIQHAYADNFTMRTIEKELSAFLNKKKVKTDYLHPFYFINYQKSFLESKIGLKKRNFWINKLKGIPFCSNLDSDSNNLEVITYQTTDISGRDFDQFKRLAKISNLPISSILNGFFKMLLKNLDISHKKLYAIVVDGREEEKINGEYIHNILGVLNNQLPFLYEDFECSLDGIRKSYMEYLECRLNQEIPYEVIREDLFKLIGKDLDNNLLGIFNFMEETSEKLLDTDLAKMNGIIYTKKKSVYSDLYMHCHLLSNGIKIGLECKKRVFDINTEKLLLDSNIGKFIKKCSRI
jgi:hypothetical protein